MLSWQIETWIIPWSHHRMDWKCWENYVWRQSRDLRTRAGQENIYEAWHFIQTYHCNCNDEYFSKSQYLDKFEIEYFSKGQYLDRFGTKYFSKGQYLDKFGTKYFSKRSIFRYICTSKRHGNRFTH